ncbi:hypothetical protein Lal_00036701 [Lupinus albus]|uniref:Uncharacterized protein n=1 Tax=Lupinus albus TaxID=3870 RepID=A0A6A4PU38_LUPAL|nr:hypothetical protein Lalb_Chr10g0091741 [Lupinus albus]KAF1888662.1 hypothetical protein Lal_00036701 [Lupinus albus]
MKSLSSIGLGLSIVFGFLLLALVAEVYYLLWWKKRIITNRELQNNEYRNPMKELFYMFCWKTTSTTTSLRKNTTCFTSQDKEFIFKPFGEDNDNNGVDGDYMLGPSRFLFTIVEESKEDLECEEDGIKCRKDSKGKSLGDLLVVETPYLTPNASPTFFTPINISPYNQHGLLFNPLFESKTDAEFNRMKSSPPPKFKFLQQAEEKLRRKLQDEQNMRKNEVGDDGSFISVVVDKKIERDI